MSDDKKPTKESSFGTRMLQSLSGKDLGTRILKGIGGVFGIDLVIQKKISQEPIADYIFDPRAQVRKPKWNYVMIYDEAIKSWVFRQIVRAIIQEVIIPEMRLTKKFAHRCEACRTDYDSEEEVCNTCGGKKFIKPNLDERKIAQNLMDQPNPDYSFKELSRSALFWHLMLDDTYISIAYKNARKKDKDTKKISNRRIPAEVYVEDSRFTFPVVDQYGHYGNDEYFCPKCYDPEMDNFHGLDNEGNPPTACPESDCGGPLLQTCYVMQFGDKTKQRFGKDEIVQGSSDRLLPSLFGNPKIISVWKLILTIGNMDDYNEEVFKDGTTGAFIAFPKMSKNDVLQLKADLQKEKDQRNKDDIVSGRRTTTKKINTYMIPTKEDPPVWIPVLPEAGKMQSLAFYKLYRESICAVFGVTPIFVGVIESGKSGNNPRMQIDVQKGTTQENQQFLSDLWNDKIFPIFGINDWEVQFGDIEQVDELRAAQIWEHLGTAAQIWTGLGHKVILDEHGNLEISHEPDAWSESEPKPEPSETPEPTEEDVSEESGEWIPHFKGNDALPSPARKIREEMGKELLKIIDGARKTNDVKVSYAKGKKVIDGAHKQLIEAARVALSQTLKRDMPELPSDVMRKLNEITKERKKEFRKILKDELAREEE